MIRSFVASMLFVALVAGCGSSVGPETTESADAAPTVVSATSLSPLEDTLGFPSDPELRQFQVIAMQRDADSAMVQCMKRSGFFYAVRPAEDVFRSGAFVGDGARDWTLQNGLGITSSFVDALASDAAQAVSDAATTNLDYVGSLTDDQAVDYDRALVGEIANDGTATEYVPGGCFAESFTSILQMLALIDEFEPGLASLNSRLHADPRVMGFQASWSECMKSAGYSYVNENALVDDVYARLLEIELVDRQGVTQIVSADALDGLAAYEKAVAIAGFDCRLAFADELARLRYDYEQEFLDDNRFRIAELITPVS